MARTDPIGKNGLVMFDPIKDPNVALYEWFFNGKKIELLQRNSPVRHVGLPEGTFPETSRNTSENFQLSTPFFPFPTNILNQKSWEMDQ